MKLKILILLSALFLGIKQALFVSNLGNATYLAAGASYLLIILVFIILLKIDIKITKFNLVIFIYLFWCIIAIFRGFFEAENYWDWKAFLLNNILVMLLPLVSVIGTKSKITQEMFFNFVKYLLPASVIVFILSARSINADGFARFVSPVYYLIIFIPLLTRKWKIIIMIVSLISFFSNIDSRSNLIRIIVCYGIVAFYYLKDIFKRKLIEIIRLSLFIIPILLFILALSGLFNVFEMDTYIKGDFSYSEKDASGQTQEESFTADTRTFLYDEVISSGLKRDTWLFGESAVAGYISDAFFVSIYDTGSKGRGASEVGILNIFNSLGLIGVIIYTLVFFYASFLSVNRSQNYISKLLGIFIAFRWLYSWIEEFTDFDMNFFFLWLVVGLCFSETFRNKTDRDVTIWVRGIFNKKYRKLEIPVE